MELNITEDETKRSVNTDKSISVSSESNEDYDNSAEDRTLLARVAFEKKLPKTVGGLSQYGSMCLMAGAIVQDNGRISVECPTPLSNLQTYLDQCTTEQYLNVTAKTATPSFKRFMERNAD
ncbi:hypothetical protein IscW_ISCW002667 [Ixodes scapularis]|uniref:Uncharacterized protein n=1 Tax=Ixodes scapularis TaxID=6945 RepID=B7PCW3_IXOSC|nr:hypothetical protein IscW_ISCW002667 [Ixodes scapularis]|eukprot:XP_002410348.1 hypothetical protein IscW_ISCW002667 [Ixodes scapularis]